MKIENSFWRELYIRCEEAYITSGKPVLMLDTQEHNIAVRVAQSGYLLDGAAVAEFALGGNDSGFFGQPKDLNKLSIYIERLPNDKDRDLRLNKAIYSMACKILGGISSGDPIHGRSRILLYGDYEDLPQQLSTMVCRIQVPLPTQEQLHEEIQLFIEDADIRMTPERTENLAKLLKGFTLEESHAILNRLIYRFTNDGKRYIYSPEDAESLILEQKKEKFLGTGDLLHFMNTRSEDDLVLGGMDQIIKWIQEVGGENAFRLDYAQKRGIRSRKGLLSNGIPGCGKTESASYLANKLKLPLISFNISDSLNKFVGDTEKNVRRSLEILEAMAPCIAFMDEIDKTMNSTSNDSNGIKSNILGILLRWMEKDTGVILYGTANSTEGLHEAFKRSGRFDLRTTVYLPTKDEAVQILRNHIAYAEKLRKKHSGNPIISGFDIGKANLDALFEHLAKNLQFVNGSDLVEMVNRLMSSKDPAGGPYYTGSTGVTELNKDLIAIAKAPTMSFYCAGEGKHMEVARSYAKLMRLSDFIPASSHALFKHYLVEWDDDKQTVKQISFDELPKDAADYDKALYNTLAPHIKRFAAAYEVRLLQKAADQ